MTNRAAGPARGWAFTLAMLAFGVVALAHAAASWPRTVVVVVFGGGVLAGLVGELAATRAGLLVHHTRPRVAGVPVAVLVGWPASIYVAFLAGRLAVDGWAATAAVGAAVATLADAGADPHGVRAGFWSYPDHWFSDPRFRGVPWWNFVGWFGLTFGLSVAAQSVL